MEAHAVQFSLRDFWIEQIPDYAGDIFARRNLALEFRNFEIQVTMIHALHDFAFENFFQVLQVEDHSGDGIRFAGAANLKSEVVAVTVRIIALAKNRIVSL